MIQDIAPKKFYIDYAEKQPVGFESALIYDGQTILLRRDEKDEIVFPKVQDLADLNAEFTYLFRIDEDEYYLASFAEEGIPAALKAEGYAFERSFNLRNAEPRDMAFAGVTGMQLADWYRSHRFCGQCGEELIRDSKERMLRCPKCGRTFYPVICPGVIIAVVHDGKLLMSKYAGREYTRFALIAGFCESGESVEDTVHREVMEEVGLKVKNLRFYKSQPWPFSDTLLMGFFCELDGDDESIRLDEEELSEAGWYTPDQVPEDFEHCSLTSEMMTVFKEANGQMTF